MFPTPVELWARAEQMYTAGQSSRPAWRQLGDVTRGVWYEYAHREAVGASKPEELLPYRPPSDRVA